MLVCPQCQFQNPNTHKFCQKCGTSLTHKSCPECGTKVRVSNLRCDNCHAITGQIWWAIVSPNGTPSAAQESANPLESAPPQEAEAAQDLPPVGVAPESEMLETEVSSDTEIPIGSSTAGIAGSAFMADADASAEVSAEATPAEDLENREESAVESPEALPETEAAQASQAEAIGAETPGEEVEEDSVFSSEVDADMEALEGSESSAPIPMPAGSYLDSQQRYQLLEEVPREAISGEVTVKVLDTQPLQQSPLSALSSHSVESFYPASEMTSQKETPAWAMAIPAIAHAYLALHGHFYSNLPTIHDAWHQDERVVLLLEDRTELPLLVNSAETALTHPAQVLHWVQEMTELWAGLEEWHCRQSLLEPGNLRVDEDQVLCLQRLYAEDSNAPPSLTALGALWQRLFNGSVAADDGEDSQHLVQLQGLMGEVTQGTVSTMEELRSRLSELAKQIEPPPPTVPPTFSGGTTRLQGSDYFEDVEDSDAPTMVMPMELASLAAAGATDIGRQRTHNEDDFGIETQHKERLGSRSQSTHWKGLYILCDGMGGHESGEVASALAVDTLREYLHTYWQESLPDSEILRSAILHANQAIYQRNQEELRGGSGRMGTTLVMALVQDTSVAVAHVGDSRLYRFSRDRGLQQVTLDHEVGQREIQRGVDPATAYSRPDAYQLTQALGPRNEDFVRPDVQFFNVEEDTLLILASDGLTDNDLLEKYGSTHIEPLLEKNADLAQGVKALIDLANQYNGHDNITAIAIRALVEED
ncbi:serine/threonine phosphatase [Phormidium sp. CCY1219]|uniref:serine/threonine phosphatase n=1 Tax=Phormidium sp. CCY1219 TaxID=2886104 RepID=UPI002D1E985E|nr:serine/threonine phosphatase [Phormidium sp. CCY1219]MEB3827634.1 serine/threonine phosphatase [Phormidium sp. CCY1219]